MTKLNQTKIFMIRIFFILLLSFLLLPTAGAQTTNPKTLSPANVNAVKSSPAYAELLVQRVELEAELEDLLIAYTEEFPKVKEIRFQMELTSQALEKILKVTPAESSKLTLALGKLLVRKTRLETDLWKLRQQYSDQHPEVRQAKRKIEIFEKAIREILP